MFLHLGALCRNLCNALTLPLPRGQTAASAVLRLLARASAGGVVIHEVGEKSKKSKEHKAALYLSGDISV